MESLELDLIAPGTSADGDAMNNVSEHTHSSELTQLAGSDGYEVLPLSLRSPGWCQLLQSLQLRT